MDEIQETQRRIRELEYKIDLYSNFPFSTDAFYDPAWEVELLGLKEHLRDLEEQHG